MNLNEEKRRRMAEDVSSTTTTAAAASSPISYEERLAALKGELAKAKEKLQEWSLYKEQEALFLQRVRKLEEQVAGEWALPRTTMNEKLTLSHNIALSSTKTPSGSNMTEITPLPLHTKLQTAFLGRLVLKNRRFVPRTFVSLEEHLWGNEEELDFIFVRDWYAACAGKILTEFAKNVVIVAGNKGTGKTVFGILLVVEAIREGFAVVYETAREKVWIVGQGDSTRDFSDIEDCFRIWKMHPAALQPGVYSLRYLESDIFTDLVRRRSVIYVVDVDDSYRAEIDPYGPKVIISSPNFDKLKRIHEVRNVVYHYLPLWSWEEVQLFNDNLPLATEDANIAYVRRDAEELKIMFDTFGGVPRTLFKKRSAMDAFDDIEKCLSDTSPEVLKQAFTF